MSPMMSPRGRASRDHKQLIPRPADDKVIGAHEEPKESHVGCSKQFNLDPWRREEREVEVFSK